MANRAGKVDLRVGEGALQGDGGGVVTLDRDVEHGTGQTLDSVGRAQCGDLTRPPRPSSIVTETGLKIETKDTYRGYLNCFRHRTKDLDYR